MEDVEDMVMEDMVEEVEGVEALIGVEVAKLFNYLCPHSGIGCTYMSQLLFLQLITATICDTEKYWKYNVSKKSFVVFCKTPHFCANFKEGGG